MSKATNTPAEFSLRMNLSAVADKYGKVAALKIVQEWARTKIDEPGRVK